MKHREYICHICGAKGIDRSNTNSRKFCSAYCQQVDYRRRHGIGVSFATPSCIHNSEVICVKHKCSTCGWNPKVEQRRKEALAYG